MSTVIILLAPARAAQDALNDAENDDAACERMANAALKGF
jgi:hypothetical protein